MKRWIANSSVVALVLMLAGGPARAQFKLGDLMESGPTAKKIAVFELKGALLEKPQDETLSFGETPPIALKDLLERMKKAREDASVRAVVLTFEGAAMGAGQMEELRKGMQAVQAAGKDVVVRLEDAHTGLYALATAASRISMVPNGDLWLTGLYGEGLYLKGLLQNLKVEADFEHMGAYKSAAETLTRTGPSKESEEMTNWLLDSMYDSMLKMIADGRHLSVDKVKALVDGGPYSAQKAKEAGLIDEVEYHDEFMAHLKKKYGDEAKITKSYGEKKDMEIPEDFFGAVQFVFKMLKGGGEEEHGDSIGVVYVEGPILTGESPQGLFGGESGAGSTSIRRALEKAAEDDSVRAVVLRVDSPGGSALASEIIWKATQEVAKKKPFIVSMGNVAGSGGYYVSCGAETIFADDTTITASIGVVGGKLITAGMWDWMGVNWVPHQRGKNAAMLSSARKFNDEERKRFIQWMDDIYGVFKSRVVAGRGKKLAKPIEEMAGGRVFTGKQALELGLVDRIGGMDDAIKYAAAQARIDEYDVRVIPKPKNIFDLFTEGLSKHDDQDVALGMRSLLEHGSPLVQTVLPLLRTLDPERTRALWSGLLRLDLIHREGVITMMPEDLIIR